MKEKLSKLNRRAGSGAEQTETARVKVSARSARAHSAPKGRGFSPIAAIGAAFGHIADYYRGLGKHRLLYAIVACLLLIMTPFSVAFCVPFQAASATTDNSLHINSTGVLSAAAVEAAEPVKVYSAEPGYVGDVVIDMQTRLMELAYMGEDEPSDYYGDETKEAILRFQRRHDLPMTGSADYITFDLLFSENAKFYAVTEGAEGDDVLELQERLVELGYLKFANGVYDAETVASVKKFQSRNSLTADGTIGQDTREKLYSEDVNAYAYYVGEESEEIRTLQQYLYTLGYLTMQPDGKYGGDTVAAVKRFQERNGLIADGYLGVATKNLLLSGEGQKNSIGLGDNGADVTRIQERLVALGYMRSATGYFGEGTVDALKAFQKRNGLSADGKYGSATRDRLFSPNAKKAPKPSKPSTSKPSGGSSGGGSSGGTSNGTSWEGAGTGSVSAFIKIAESRLGCKYVLGAKGPNKFDCSGLVYWCLNQAGVKQGYMTSYTWRSCTKYQRINNRGDVKAGDVLVFKGHVGIAVSNGIMIDASTSKGKVVKRSSYGSYWDPRFICAYRIF